MNIQHSSENDSWMTPPWLIARCKKVLGTIDLDPASSATANLEVRAREYFTAEENGLAQPWKSGTIFINPPGGKLRGDSIPSLFWERLMEKLANGDLRHAIFIAFSLEQLAVSQGRDCPAMGEFSLCIPQRRIRFLSADGKEGLRPSHSNAIIYVPGYLNEREKFFAEFRDLGTCMCGVA